MTVNDNVDATVLVNDNVDATVLASAADDDDGIDDNARQTGRF